MSKIYDISEFDAASSGSVIRMQSSPNDTHPFYADYDLLTLSVDAVMMRAPLHLSGQSGTGKSHFLNTLLYGPVGNMRQVAQGLELPRWSSVKVYRLFVSTFETPSEIWYKTEVSNFSTEDRPQKILEILAAAAANPRDLHVVWLVESGRGIAESIQGGFLEIVGTSVIRGPHEDMFEAGNLTFVTDSNHAANEAGEFAIFDLDQAYARRWTRRVIFGGLDPEQESMVLRDLAPDAVPEQIRQVVSLAMEIREKHREGVLQSILPPTIDAELDLLGCMRRLPIDVRSLVFSTLLGHCASGDRDEAETVFAEAFGVRVKTSTPAGEAVGVL